MRLPYFAAFVFVSVLACVVVAAPVDAASDSLLQQALAAESRNDTTAALELFRRADALHPDNAFVLQKISLQLSELVEEAAGPADKRRLALESLSFAERAARLEPHNAVDVLSVAIGEGKLALLEDNRGRVERSRLMREYAERALALDPDYALAHHVLGRWHYEVASLGAAKRMLVRLIYGGLPPASTVEAVRHLRRATELDPQSPAHHAELGFALLADGQPAAARAAFAQALTLPARNRYDQAAQNRARHALATP
jgi:tetratricopeptide (TPR) repeat protein